MGAFLPSASSGMKLRERFVAFRNRLIASRRFQRFALAFPLTRPIAHNKALALFDLCAGFVYSQVLLASVRLDLFRILSDGPLTVDGLAERLSLSPAATARLMRATAALKLTEQMGEDCYALGELGAALLGNPGVAEMVEHHAVLYGDLTDPLAVLRGRKDHTALARFWGYGHGDAAGAETGGTSDYSALMAASQPPVIEDVLAAYRFDRHRHLLDIGGGHGAFAIAVAEAAPDLHVALFDLPSVAEEAESRFAKAGLEDRCNAVGGDFFRDPFPADADIIAFVRVCYDHDDKTVAKLFKKAHAALTPGGTVLIAETMASADATDPIADTYFNIYLLAMGGGRPRTSVAFSKLLEQAGFLNIRTVPSKRAFMTRIITAEKSR